MTVFPIRGLKYTWLDANRVKITFTKETNKSGFNYDAFYGMDGVKRDKFYLGTYYCPLYNVMESKRSQTIDFETFYNSDSFIASGYVITGSNYVGNYYYNKRNDSGNNSTANNYARYTLELGRNLWYRIMALAMCYKTLDVSKSGSIFYNKANNNTSYTTGYSDTYGLNGVSSNTNGGLKALGVEDFWSYQTQLIDGIYLDAPNGNGNGMPTYYFKINGQSVAIYDNGNGCGMPKWYMEKRGRQVVFFFNGNGNGIPTKSFDDVNDIKDIIKPHIGIYKLYNPPIRNSPTINSIAYLSL